MKVQVKVSGILFLILFFGVLLIQSNIIYATNQQCPVDVQILYSDDSWCSGTFNETGAWDTITITFVTLGVANLDTNTHSLNQLILTINVVNNVGSLSYLKSENLSSDADLPLILSPQRYWVYNLSCSTCQSLAKINLEVDGEWYEFTPEQLIVAGIYIGNTYWPPHWSEVLYYTESNITPVSFLGIFSGVGLATMIFVFRRCSKRV